MALRLPKRLGSRAVARARYWLTILRSALSRVYWLVAFVIVVVGGSIYAGIGTSSGWSEASILLAAVLVALAIVLATLEGAYQLRDRSGETNFTLQSTGSGLSIPPYKSDNVVTELACFPVRVTNRGERPIELDVMLHSLAVPGGLGVTGRPVTERDYPLGPPMFEHELRRRWDEGRYGRLLVGAIRIDAFSSVTGVLVFAWWTDESALAGGPVRNVWSVNVEELISGQSWSNVRPYDFDSTKTSPDHRGPA